MEKSRTNIFVKSVGTLSSRMRLVFAEWVTNVVTGPYIFTVLALYSDMTWLAGLLMFQVWSSISTFVLTALLTPSKTIEISTLAPLPSTREGDLICRLNRSYFATKIACYIHLKEKKNTKTNVSLEIYFV